MTRLSKLLSDERELTPEEQEEIDLKAEEITANIFFGTGEQSETAKAADEKGAVQAAAVTVKKRPGRPKRIHQDEAKSAQNEVTVHEDPQREVPVIPDVVRETVLEKMDLLERMIKHHEESIWELRTKCEQEISDIEKLKTECISKHHSLRSFLEVAEHGQG